MSDKKLTPKQTKFLDYVFDKFPEVGPSTYEDAKDYAGYSKETKVREVVDGLKDEIINRIKHFIAIYGLEAFGEQMKLLRMPVDKTWRAKLAITDSILNRVGVVSKNDESEGKMPVGIIVLPPKASECQKIVSEE